MYPVIVISVVVCICLIYTVLKNPVLIFRKKIYRIKYWFCPLIGSLILIISKLLPLDTMIEGLTSSGNINPIKILILFISMTILSIFLDEAGMFSFLAAKAAKIAGANQLKLFIIIFSLVSILTVFTSNDIIILTFTPFICYFSQKAKINPIPYLFGEFVAANTWSMLLIIGNPTNIYLASFAEISFGSYIQHMFTATIFAGFGALIMLLIVFRKPLSEPIQISYEDVTLENKIYVYIGLAHLIICTILLIFSSYIGLEMWYITLGFAISLFISISIYGLISHKSLLILWNSFKRAPFELIPFVLSMFLIVLSLDKYYITSLICDILGENYTIVKYGIASFLTANFMNNIPMSVAFSSITSHLSNQNLLKGIYASIIGSNIGAYFTPLGALAGIMWTGILNKMGIAFSFKKYISYGIRISIPVLIFALLGLKLCFTLLK